MKHNAIALGIGLLLSLAGSAQAQSFPYCNASASNTGGVTTCVCPTNTFMTGINFTLNGDGEKMNYSLSCEARSDVKLTGSPFKGPEVADNNTGNTTTTQCGPGNVMIGLYFVNNGSRFKITSRCQPATPLTQANPPSGPNSTTRNTGSSATSNCPDNSLAQGLTSRFTDSAFNFMTLCWRKG